VSSDSTASTIRPRGRALGTQTGVPLVTKPMASRLELVLSAPATWLALLVGISAAVRSAIAVRVPSPWILPDEVVYSELAKSIASGHRPSVRGVPVFGWGEVYPTLISPAWVLFEDPVHAYHAALAINGLVMSLAAVPAYLLARLFVSRRASFAVAAMTVLVPSMAYTSVVMTENAFYPVFLLSVYLIARAVRRPTIGNQALALTGLGLVAFTRIQGVALAAAYVMAVVLYAITGPRAERLPYLRRLVPSAAPLLVLPIAIILASFATGRGALGWLGSHSGTFAEFHLREVPEWFAYLTGGLILYVALVPLAASTIIVGRGLSRRSSERVRLFAALAVPTFVALVGSVSLVSASMDVDGWENLNERYVFYIVPMLFVGLGLWVDDGLRKPRPWTLVLLGACVILAAIVPIHRLAYNAQFQSLALLPWIKLSATGIALACVVGTFTLACGAVWLRCRRDRAGRLWLLAGVWMAFLGAVAVGQTNDPASYFANAFAGRSATWVDESVPEGANVRVLWDQRNARRSPDFFYYWLAVTEFFNKSVADVYSLGGPTYYETFLPTVRVRQRPDGTVVDPGGRPLRADYMLVTCRTPVEGTVVGRASRGVLTLVRVGGGVRMTGGRPCRRAAP
jgi:hypothetical protein